VWVVCFLINREFDPGKAIFSASLTGIFVVAAILISQTNTPKEFFFKVNWIRLALIVAILVLSDRSAIYELNRDFWSVSPLLALALLAESIAIRFRRRR
jgi:hypothetical protein